MVFPETVAFDFILLELEEGMLAFEPPEALPLPCDRWLARSCLQKAIRRNEIETALRALASMIQQDARPVWRHLIVIALEDVGVANMPLLQQVVAASRNRSWRNRNGDDWRIASFLVSRMCESAHCQAACDLLLTALNCPSLERTRAEALTASRSHLVESLKDEAATLEHRAVAALGLGGALDEAQTRGDPSLVFSLLRPAEHVATICSAAWTTSRNPMSLLLPLVWQQWRKAGRAFVLDDPFPAAYLLGEIPEYAVDQFTRAGLQVARTYAAQDQYMRSAFHQARLPRSQHARCVGALLFLIEGGLVRRRVIWPAAEQLASPFRLLRGAVRLGEFREGACERLKSTLGIIRSLRRTHLSS